MVGITDKARAKLASVDGLSSEEECDEEEEDRW